MEIVCTAVEVVWGEKKDGTDYQFAKVSFLNPTESTNKKFSNLKFGDVTESVSLFFDSEVKKSAFISTINGHSFPCHARLLTEMYIQSGRPAVRFTGLQLLDAVSTKKAA